MKPKYISQSPYLTAGLTRAELFNPKKKRDTSMDGVSAANKRLQKKGKKNRVDIYFGKNDHEWRFF